MLLNTRQISAAPHVAEDPKRASRLSERKLLAAKLVAEDRISNAAIGKKCGVTKRAIEKWKLQPDFAAEVERHKAAWREKVLHCGIADRVKRIERLDADWRRLRLIRLERGKDSDLQDIPGGKTGLICHTVKGIGKGEDFQAIDEYKVDTGLLAELRAIEEQAARELGQWTEKHDLTGGAVVVKRLIGVPLDAF